MRRRPPRSTQSRSSAASDVYKRQPLTVSLLGFWSIDREKATFATSMSANNIVMFLKIAVSYTHLRAHETRHDLVCRLLLEKKKRHLARPSCKTTKTIPGTARVQHRTPTYSQSSNESEQGQPLLLSATVHKTNLQKNSLWLQVFCPHKGTTG